MNFENKKYLDYKRPLDHSLMMEYVNEFSERYPFLSITSLGESILGKSIPIITLGQGDTSVLYVGAHGGTEWITSIALLRFINEYSELYKNKRTVFSFDVEYLYSSKSIHVVPMLNPDGVDYQINGITNDNVIYDRVMKMNGNSEDFSTWQANARGVDLRYNYNSGFSEHKKVELESGLSCGASEKFSGNMPESEPEVALLCNYLRFNENVKGIIGFITQKNEIYYPSDSDDIRSKKIGAALSRMSGYKPASDNGIERHGGFCDWCASALGRYAFSVSCKKAESQSQLSDNFKLYADLREMLFSFPTMIS